MKNSNAAATKPPKYSEINSSNLLMVVLAVKELNEDFFIALMDEDCNARAYCAI
jgi:hypothetical protein